MLTDVESGAGHLLARVIVNRLWQHHFGRGIVKTPNDFGHLGAEPSHPQLLDWLASELIRNDWHLKPLHRLIMNSATYRQASGDRWLEFDAENQWVWHYRTRRLEAELIRDNLLSVSGSLNTKMYGPGVPLDIESKDADKPEARRRSIYTVSQRFTPHPLCGSSTPSTTSRVSVAAQSARHHPVLFSCSMPHSCGSRPS